MNNKTQELLAELHKNIGLNKPHNPSVISNVALGMEDGDPIVQESTTTLKTVIEDTITDVFGFGIEDGSVTDAQINAAKYAAAISLDPTAFKKRRLKQPTVPSDAIQANLTALGIEDTLPADHISTEAFDGQSLTNTVYYTTMSNFLAAKQNAFGELFYPTITIDPAMAGAVIETRVLHVHDNFSRDTNGSVSKPKFNKVNIIKAITDPNGLSVDKNRLVPVLREGENDDLFLKDLKYVSDVTGENITTAPIKMGVSFDLLGISQTDAQLTRGTMDITDALDRRVNLTNLYFSIGEDIFVSDVTTYPFSNFIGAGQDDSKDISLSFNTDSIILNTSTTKKIDGSSSDELGKLPADHKIRVRFVIHGNSNTETADTAVYASAVELVEVRNASGQIVPTDSDVYKDAKDLVAKIKVDGYELEAYATNSNLRKMGLLIGIDRKTIVYTVPNRTGVSILKPTGSAFDVENDANDLADQGSIHGITASKHAVKQLLAYENSLSVITTNGGVGDSIQLAGIGSYLVTPYYAADVIAMTTAVDSVRSKDRDEDIQAAINTKIKAAVLSMYSGSLYGEALKILNGGIEGKVDVLIGTDPTLEQYITKGNGLDLGDKFRAHVASTSDLSMTGKIYITFGIMGDKRHTQPNPLNFGQMFWAPDMTAVVDRSTEGAVYKQFYNAPRFLHVNNLPILTRLTVTGIDQVLKKITVNTKEQN